MKLGCPCARRSYGGLAPSRRIPDGVSIKTYVRFAQIAERGLFDMLFRGRCFLAHAGRESARFLPARAAHAALRARHDDGENRLVATATDLVQRALQRRSQVRVARSHQRRARGLEHRHVLSPLEAYNFGYEAHFEHADRYRRADEFTQVVRGLWDCLDDDAVVIDRSAASLFEPAGSPVNHDGPFFKVRGPCRCRERHRASRSRAGGLVRGRQEPRGEIRPRSSSPSSATLRARRRSTATSRRARNFWGAIPPRARAAGRDADRGAHAPGGAGQVRPACRASFIARRVSRRWAAPGHGPVGCSTSRGRCRRGHRVAHAEPRRRHRRNIAAREHERARDLGEARRFQGPQAIDRHGGRHRGFVSGMVRRRAVPTASTSCRPSCRAGSRTSWISSCPNQRGACSAKPMQGICCANTWGCRGRRPAPDEANAGRQDAAPRSRSADRRIRSG